MSEKNGMILTHFDSLLEGYQTVKEAESVEVDDHYFDVFATYTEEQQRIIIMGMTRMTMMLSSGQLEIIIQEFGEETTTH